MQKAFDFGQGDDILLIYERLKPFLGYIEKLSPLSVVEQLAKSIISSRTKDAVSQAAYDGLRAAYPDLVSLSQVPVSEIERIIRPVTHAADRAQHLSNTLKRIYRLDPNFSMTFLHGWPLIDILNWLESLDGVGPKVAAATANFGEWALTVFVADTHVVRVLRRFGYIGPRASFQIARDRVTMAREDWTAEWLQDLHIAIKILGQFTCTYHSPRCKCCALNDICQRKSVR